MEESPHSIPSTPFMAVHAAEDSRHGSSESSPDVAFASLPGGGGPCMPDGTVSFANDAGTSSRVSSTSSPDIPLVSLLRPTVPLPHRMRPSAAGSVCPIPSLGTDLIRHQVDSDTDDEEEDNDNVDAFDSRTRVCAGTVPSHIIDHGFPHPVPMCMRGGTVLKKRKTRDISKILAGSSEVWQESETLAPSPMNALAVEMISNISYGPESRLDDPACQRWIRAFKDALQGNVWSDGGPAFATNSLSALLLRCRRAEQMVQHLNFLVAINHVQLAAKVTRYDNIHLMIPMLIVFLPIASEDRNQEDSKNTI